MEDFVTKTKELANLVGALHQQGEDDSDLSGILAQLQAAVAKRVSSNITTESNSADCSDSPVSEEPPKATANLEDDGDVPVTKIETPAKAISRAVGKRKTKVTKNTGAKIKKAIPVSDRRDLANDVSPGESIDQTIAEQKPNIEDIDFTPEELAEVSENTTNALSESTMGKSTTSSMAFSGVCKICEVQAILDKGKPEDQLMIAEPSMIESSDSPVFTNLVTFAAHLKNEHALPEIGDQETSTKSDERTSHPSSSQSIALDLDGVTVEVKVEPEDPTNTSSVADKPHEEDVAVDHNTDEAGNTNNTSGSVKSNVLYLVCPHCDKKYNLHGTAKSCYDQLVFHMHRKHGEILPMHVKLYSCTECSFQTLRRRDLTRHSFVVHTDHEPRGVPCDICGKCVLPTSMIFHKAAVHGSQDVPEQVKARTAKAPCEICGKEFRGEINLQRHIKCVHNKVKDQLCHLCSQSFFAKRELQLHMFATHKINMSNMRVFKCPVEGCTYETLARRHLYVHSSVHTETKNFTCENCGKAFKSKPALTQHLRIMHNKDMEYKCPECGFSSHAKQYVQRHMVIHSDVKRHKCDFEGCSYATHFIENLTKHKKKHKDKNVEIDVVLCLDSPSVSGAPTEQH